MVNKATCEALEQRIIEQRGVFLRLIKRTGEVRKGSITTHTKTDKNNAYGLTEDEANSIHILIVDDDKSLGRMLENTIIRYTGFDCSFADSAKEALEILENSAVDVVITDIKMPDMNGIVLTTIVKEKYDSDVIIITGYYEDFTYEKAIENGASDFLEKPVRPTELILRLKRILRERAILSKRKQAEDALMKSEAQYHGIFDRAMEGIFQANPGGQFITANKALSQMLGYESPQELMATVTHIPTQLYTSEEDYKALLGLLNEFDSINHYEARFRRKDGRHIWTSTNMMSVRNYDGQILYYEGNVEDISSRKSAEEEREDSLERLRKALGSTIKALAVTVETKDPYTAGHQRRVADLARTIATKMGIKTDQIDGLRMASTIHDLGKISVPSEILTKPTKLTDLEWGIIKTHAQSGYDILKDIEFPWPIARMVLEHHERIDGSGYPNGVTGNEMLIESRIIAVADVVEAIASHRPYRPAHGIDVALDEIAKNKGILYDLEVVDTCLRLFLKHKYMLVS